MKRVLMVCYYFPPLGGIGSLRALKFATHLPEFGWEATVLAPKAGAYHRDDALLFPEERVLRTPSLEISRLGKRALRLGQSDTQAARVGASAGRAQSFARRWLYRPDAQIGWYPWAVQEGRRALRDQRYDALFSSSFPITAHLVAARLRRDFRLPWVAEFRDLWTDLGAYDSALRRRLDNRTEISLLRSATEVVTVSPSWAATLASRREAPVHVITNGFDPEDLPELPAAARPVVTHVGTHYADRQDLRTPLLALGALLKEGALPGLVLRFVGEAPEPLMGTLAEARLLSCLEVTGFVSHREAARQMMSSRLLLLAGPRSVAEAPALRGHIPAKAFEYLFSGRGILYVGDLEADVARLLRPHAHVGQVVPGDVAGAKREISRLLSPGSTTPRDGIEPYTRRALAEQLAKILSGTQP
jgi:hypothetical protein